MSRNSRVSESFSLMYFAVILMLLHAVQTAMRSTVIALVLDWCLNMICFFVDGSINVVSSNDIKPRHGNPSFLKDSTN